MSRWRWPSQTLRTRWWRRYEDNLQHPVLVHVTDDETLDTLLAAVYAQDDLSDAVEGLRRELPELSAYRTGLSRPQLRIVFAVLFIVLLGAVIDVKLTGILITGVATMLYLLYTLYRLLCAWKGWRLTSTINPTAEELAAMDGRELPSYTILLPVFGEKPQTMRTLLRSLSALDYPRQKLNGLLLLEADDDQTLTSLAEVEAAVPGDPAALAQDAADPAGRAAHEAQGDDLRPALLYRRPADDLRRGGPAGAGPAQESRVGVPACRQSRRLHPGQT